MNIFGIFLAQEIRTGGHIRYLELMEALSTNHNVTVALNGNCGYQPRCFSMLNLPIKYRHSGLYPRSRLFAHTIKKAIRNGIIRVNLGPDVILIFGETHLASAIILSRFFNSPIVFSYRSNSFRNTVINLAQFRGKPFLWSRELLRLPIDRFYEVLVNKYCSRIVFQSEYDRNDYHSRNKKTKEKLTVIRGDILQPRFKPEYAYVNQQKSPEPLLFVGTLGSRKGLVYLVEAIGILKSRGFQVSLDVLATGENFSQISALAEKNGILDQIHFRGKVSNPFAFMATAGLLVVPSTFDSYPNVVLEALHVGCPVIGTSVGGIPDMLGDALLLFKPQNAIALSDRLELLLTNNSTYHQVRELCRIRRSYFEFDWAEEWTRVLKLNNQDGYFEKN